MEICVLKFDDTHEAQRALEEALDKFGDEMTWLHDVAVVSRPIVGRVKISGTFLDRSLTYREGDLTAAAGNLGAYTGYVVANFFGPLLAPLSMLSADTEAEMRAADVEEELFRFDDIKQKLPRGSSALVLVADREICNRFAAMFKDREPDEIRRALEPELKRRFDEIHRRVAQILKALAGGVEPTQPTL
jgi:uncharacterized membrane protein